MFSSIVRFVCILCFLLFTTSFNQFYVKLQDDQPTLICEECKNLLIQFYVFKQNALQNSLLLSCVNENIEKVEMFLDEVDEEVSCMRYNKCLTLVPESQRSFMEIFKQWQPHVVLDKIESSQNFLKPENTILETIFKLDALDPIVMEPIVMEEECLEENSQDNTEEEWIQMEIGNSEIIETDDGEIESWVCTHCEPNERFVDVKEFGAHLSSHEVVEQIFIDPKGEDIEDRSEDIDASPQDEPYSLSAKEIFHNCTKCNFIAKDFDELRIHHKSHVDQKIFHNSKFERLFCADCSYQFVSQAHYQAHVNGHQLYSVIAKHSSFPVCEICNIMFCDEYFANFHQEKHEQGDLTEHSLVSEGLFLKFGHHRPEMEPINNLKSETDLKCGHCLKLFPDEESCRLHQLIFHITTLKCPIESRVFKGNQAFSIHMKNNHPDLFGDDVKFMCSVCKQKFDTLYEKLGHMKNCDKKRFQCSHCDKKFSQKCYLMTHLRQVSGQTSIACEVCQKVCRDKGDYQIHFR